MHIKTTRSASGGWLTEITFEDGAKVSAVGSCPPGARWYALLRAREQGHYVPSGRMLRAATEFRESYAEWCEARGLTGSSHFQDFLDKAILG
jgi:hypothetical protein